MQGGQLPRGRFHEYKRERGTWSRVDLSGGLVTGKEFNTRSATSGGDTGWRSFGLWASCGGPNERTERTSQRIFLEQSRKFVQRGAKSQLDRSISRCEARPVFGALVKTVAGYDAAKASRKHGNTTRHAFSSRKGLSYNLFPAGSGSRNSDD